MKFQFSNSSLDVLETCDPKLQAVLERALEFGLVDISVLEGHRSEEAQTEMRRLGRSQLAWPNSKHNSLPSRAVDVAPYFSDGRRIPWEDRFTWQTFGGLILAAGASLGVPLRWGGDWNRNWTNADQSFHDLPHFELLDD